jgi:hypothetical protein
MVFVNTEKGGSSSGSGFLAEIIALKVGDAAKRARGILSIGSVAAQGGMVLAASETRFVYHLQGSPPRVHE